MKVSGQVIFKLATKAGAPRHVMAGMYSRDGHQAKVY